MDDIFTIFGGKLFGSIKNMRFLNDSVFFYYSNPYQYVLIIYAARDLDVIISYKCRHLTPKLR